MTSPKSFLTANVTNGFLLPPKDYIIRSEKYTINLLLQVKNPPGIGFQDGKLKVNSNTTDLQFDNKKGVVLCNKSSFYKINIGFFNYRDLGNRNFLFWRERQLDPLYPAPNGAYNIDFYNIDDKKTLVESQVSMATFSTSISAVVQLEEKKHYSLRCLTSIIGAHGPTNVNNFTYSMRIIEL